MWYRTLYLNGLEIFGYVNNSLETRSFVECIGQTHWFVKIRIFHRSKELNKLNTDS